ncbi:MAG: type II toxin-antitoxin system HicA family toxin [Nitrososphaerales archaeon]|nr:type II toxin-antitoxin system HicA family toxin [Nitrososphaerales archaeon]
MGKVGYVVDHQTGSHVVLRHVEAPHRRVTVPYHQELAKGTLRAILNEVGLTVDEFLGLL